MPFTNNVNCKYMDMYLVPDHGRMSVQFLLAYSDDVMRFKILSDWSMSKSRITALDFRKADLKLFRCLLASILWDTALERRGIQKNLLIFKITLSKLKKVRSQQVGKQARATGGLLGWARSSLLNLDIKWNYIWIGSRDRQNKRSIELLFYLARAGVRKARADMELSLAKDQQGNKKGFYKYMNIKKRTKENMSLQLNENKWYGKGQGTQWFFCLSV